MFDDVQRIWETVIAVILAAMGGLARLLSLKDEKRLRWSLILSELFVSGFAGLMVLMLIRATGVTGDWIGLVCGMAGWIGPKILDLLIKPAKKAIGLGKDDTGKEE